MTSDKLMVVIGRHLVSLVLGLQKVSLFNWEANSLTLYREQQREI